MDRLSHPSFLRDERMSRETVINLWRHFNLWSTYKIHSLSRREFSVSLYKWWRPLLESYIYRHYSPQELEAKFFIGVASTHTHKKNP